MSDAGMTDFMLDHSDIRWGIKLSMNNIGFENNIMTIPYFCTFLMKEWIKDKPTGNG